MAGVCGWLAGDRLDEPVAGAFGTARWNQAFRQEKIACGSTRKEVLSQATCGPSSPTPPASGCPHPSLCPPFQGSHWADSSRPGKHLDGAHSSSSRGPALHSAAWLPDLTNPTRRSALDSQPWCLGSQKGAACSVCTASSHCQL